MYPWACIRRCLKRLVFLGSTFYFLLHSHLHSNCYSTYTVFHHQSQPWSTWSFTSLLPSLLLRLLEPHNFVTWVTSNQIPRLGPFLPLVHKSCCEEGSVCHSTQNTAPASQNWLLWLHCGKAKRLCFVFPSNNPIRRLLSLFHLDRPLKPLGSVATWGVVHEPHLTAAAIPGSHWGRKTLRPYVRPPQIFRSSFLIKPAKLMKTWEVLYWLSLPLPHNLQQRLVMHLLCFFLLLLGKVLPLSFLCCVILTCSSARSPEDHYFFIKWEPYEIGKWIDFI